MSSWPWAATRPRTIPVGFKWFIEAKKARNAKLVVVDPRFTRTAAVADLYAPIRAGDGHRVPAAASSATPSRTKRYHEDYVKLHTNAPLPRGREVRLQGRASSPASTRPRANTPRTTGRYQPDAKTQAYGVDADPPGPALRVPAPEEARRAATRRRWWSGSAARPRTSFLKVAEIVTSTGNAAARGDHHLRAGLDPALDRRADDPRRRDPAAPARQRGPARRRRQRLPRPLEHPGRHRHRRARSRSCPATSRRRRARQATLKDYLETRSPPRLNKQAWASMNYWVELPEVHGLAAQGGLRQRGDQGERLRLRLAAQGGRQLLVALHLRRHVPRQLHPRRRPGAGARRASSPSA